ncbi:hypothetical protein ACOMICROBIO_GDFFDHBD_04201 (plasmid) [Vibrio sp. B1REV9]|nr:hypothetical protein ACOMICROBIO_GDFFDHBD_04201 [Vibrio sp. B1REV9]
MNTAEKKDSFIITSSTSGNVHSNYKDRKLRGNTTFPCKLIVRNKYIWDKLYVKLRVFILPSIR